MAARQFAVIFSTNMAAVKTPAILYEENNFLKIHCII